MKIDNLYKIALEHRSEHNCSAPPYENGIKLIDAVIEYKPNRILEIGTGIGYTTVIMALAAPTAHIDTLEKDPEHAQIADDFIRKQNVQNQIQIINQSAEDFFEQTNKHYDFIFFDGFQIHLQFLAHYERLLKPGGILFLANNHLKSRTSEQFFQGLQDETKWKILDQFADTTIVLRMSH